MSNIQSYSIHLKGPNKQKGAVLIVSLLLLLVMTLMALTGMQTSTMQEKMASNAQNSNRTFQAAESAVGASITTIIAGTTDALTVAMNSGTNLGPVTTFDVGDAKLSIGSQVEYLGEVILSEGQSINADESSTAVTGHRFEIRSTASIEAVQAAATVFQGIKYQ